MEKMLSIAIQKSGRLSEKSLDIIRGCGIEFGNDARVLREVGVPYAPEKKRGCPFSSMAMRR